MSITVLHWYNRLCMLSLLETKNYDINAGEVYTTNLPHISSILGNYARFCANIFYFFGILTVIYITFYTKKLNSLFKYTFFTLFTISYIKNNLLVQLTEREKYNNGLLYKCLMTNPFI